ncbi:MAG: MFS transporter [Deltaproteobacteria bacterium]
MPDTNGSPGGVSVEPISRAYAHYVLGVLFLVYVINFIDRQVLSVFIGPIKEEFGVSDTAMGLLVGLAFALFYTIAGIPIARWADRGNRRTIIALGLTVWSAMTVTCGLARSFVQLALARVGVGVGEAAGSPPAHSLISDYFPVERRATAMGIYSWGIYVGSALAYLGGGYLRTHFDWRTAFIVLGIPGLLVALLVRFTVREPPRGYSEKVAVTAEAATFGETLAHLLSCRSWVYLVAGTCFLSLTGYGVLMWGYEFFGRIHAMPPMTIGMWMAGIVGIGGSIGSYSGGALADRLGRHDPAWYMRLPALVTAASVPLAVAFLMAESSAAAMSFFFVFYILANFYVPAMHTINQNLSKLRMRATAAAILLFIVNLVGAGAGPFVVGLLNDVFAPSYGQEAIRYSLLSVAMTGIFGAAFLWLSSRHLASDLERARE